MAGTQAGAVWRAGVLELGRDPSGPRHLLDGKILLCGTGLEMKWWTGDRCVWMPCRYEADLAPLLGTPPIAFLMVVLPGIEDREVTVKLTYTTEIEVRWPYPPQPKTTSAWDLSTDHGCINRYVDPKACPTCGNRRRPCGC